MQVSLHPQLSLKTPTDSCLLEAVLLVQPPLSPALKSPSINHSLLSFSNQKLYPSQ